MPGPNYIRNGKKRCNGPFHKGEYIPLAEFWFFKRGQKAGKPMSRCMDCTRLYASKQYKGAYVSVQDVRFIFLELENRLGRNEAIRRIGTSQNFYIRLDDKKKKWIRKDLVQRGIEALLVARANNEVRHKDSISHGSSVRGRKERKVVNRDDLYRRHGDDDNERRKKERSNESLGRQAC